MKRYITLINLILIAIVIHYGVNSFYKIAILKLDVSDVAAAARKKTSPVESEAFQPMAYYQPIFERHLFGKEPETNLKPEQIQIDALKQTELKLKLWGTVIGGNNQTYAVIESDRAGQNLYRAGDAIQNATIKMILREKVVLNINGQDEILEMEKLLAATGARPSPIQTAVSVPQNISINRSQLEGAVQNPNQLLQEIRIRPHFEKGKLDGLTITAIKPDSIFRKMGLVSGDILTSVDGEKIESMNDALKFYETIKSASAVKLDIKRRGQMQTINYNIEP
ncbi:MAG: type II secretion system protein N [Desulfobacterales bacterium]|nr:type II secretion system protein N [Desulfobacterales bacterium]